MFPLAECARDFYVPGMKRISFWLALVLFTAPFGIRAQDAATEERLNKLTAQIQDLVEAQGAQSKRIEALAKEVQAMQQEQSNKPVANYASQDDVKELAAKLKEVDRKRQEDNDRILEVLKKLGKSIGASPVRHTSAPPSKVSEEISTSNPTTTADKGFEYVVQKGDTLGAIVKAYGEKNIKVTVKQILDANPGLKPESLYVGKKIFIPAPAQ